MKGYVHMAACYWEKERSRGNELVHVHQGGEGESHGDLN